MRLTPETRQELERMATRLEHIARSSEEFKNQDFNHEVSRLLACSSQIRQVALRTTSREQTFTSYDKVAKGE